MHRTISYRQALLSLIFILGSSPLFPQVHIRDRVTIAPTTTDTTHGAQNQLTEKWMALTKNAVKITAVNSGTNKTSSLIGFAKGGGLSITVLDGTSAASLDLIIRSPIQQVIVADANSNHGFTWDTTGLPGGFLDIGLIWHYWGASGSEYGCSVQQVNDTTYMLGFEDTNYPPYFVDLIVKVVISPQPHDYHFAVTVVPDTIVYDDYANISALLVDKDGNEVPLDGNTPVILTATPENTGWFYTDNPVPYGDLKAGNVLYRAGGMEPLEPQDVTMAVDAGGITGQGKLVVKPKPCLVMQLSKTNVSPGDTVQVTFLALQYDGQLTPYTQDQLFYVWMNTDESFGTLQSAWGEQGSWLFGPQPFMFIAASSISADSLLVQLEAEPSSGGIAGSVRKGPKLELQKEAKASVAKLMNIVEMKVRPASKELVSVKAQTANEGKTVVPQQVNSVALWKEFKGINRTAQEGAACMPTGTVVVKESTIVKVTAAVATLTPLGDADNKDNPGHNKNGPDKRLKIIDWSKRKPTDVTVTVTDSKNNPIPNYQFTLSAFVRPNSGGHDHNDGRPTGKFITPAKDTVATFQGSTNSNGTATYTYICSGFGGVDSLHVKGKTDKDTASAVILLKIADLVELIEGTNFKLIGDKPIHKRNHYGTKSTTDKLKILADSAYADSAWVLQYNDISLIDGGPFDVSTAYVWNTPHQHHREGRNVDMRPVASNKDSVDVQWLQRFVEKKLKGTVKEEYKGILDQHHFHLSF